MVGANVVGVALGGSGVRDGRDGRDGHDGHGSHHGRACVPWGTWLVTTITRRHDGPIVTIIKRPYSKLTA